MTIFVEFFVETGPTQTVKPINDQALDKTTNSIRSSIIARTIASRTPGQSARGMPRI
ncbi:hypothetical protein GBA52_020742 [Prunus armeniaca]|nr:hypothetical protein GBA52_020742 [Prunus armeniaca]